MKQREQQPEKKEIEEEERRVKTLRFLVDFSLAYLAQTKLSLEEAQAEDRGQRAEFIFPGKRRDLRISDTCPEVIDCIGGKYANTLALSCILDTEHMEVA